jgi:hypothetical protein
MEGIYAALNNVIPPAAALAVIAYLSRFFGKAIADQKPFADDREWEIELAGVTFIVNLWPGLLGIAAAFFLPHLGKGWMHAVDFFVLTMLTLALMALKNNLAARYFAIETVGFGGKLLERESDFKSLRRNWIIYLMLIQIALFYVGTAEYLSANIFWIILFWSAIFTSLIFLALIQSIFGLSGEESVPVDIYFVDKTIEPLTGVTTRKVNDDNIRARVGDKMLIINKSQILKIEMKIPEKILPKEI